MVIAMFLERGLVSAIKQGIQGVSVIRKVADMSILVRATHIAAMLLDRIASHDPVFMTALEKFLDNYGGEAK